MLRICLMGKEVHVLPWTTSYVVRSGAMIVRQFSLRLDLCWSLVRTLSGLVLVHQLIPQLFYLDLYGFQVGNLSEP